MRDRLGGNNVDGLVVGVEWLEGLMVYIEIELGGKGYGGDDGEGMVGEGDVRMKGSRDGRLVEVMEGGEGME